MQSNPQPTEEDTPGADSGRLMYTVAEVARLLGIGRSTAYELMLSGELPAVRMGRRWLVSPMVLRDLLGQEPPAPHMLP